MQGHLNQVTYFKLHNYWCNSHVCQSSVCSLVFLARDQAFESGESPRSIHFVLRVLSRTDSVTHMRDQPEA